MVHSGYHPLKHRPHSSVWMVHSGYHPLKHRGYLSRIVFGWCTVDIILKHSPLRIVFGWCTVDIILLSIVLLG